MAERTISVTELARNLADFVNRVAYRGERFLVTRGNRPVAEILPAPRGRRLGELEAMLRRLPSMAPDEADAFGRDVEAAREELPPGTEGPWGS